MLQLYKASDRDMAMCARLYGIAAGDEDPDVYTENCIRVRMETYPDDIYYIASVDGKAVGGVLVLAPRNKGDSYWLNGFAVLPEFRGKSYGSSIIDVVVKELLDKNISDSVCLGVRPNNEVAKALYAKLGFSKIQETARIEVWEKKL